MSDKMIRELWVYPVKSLRGIPVQAASVRRMGFEFDRRWMLVDERGRFLTQREHPRMATISTDLEDSTLIIRDSSGGSCTVPTEPPRGDLIPVTIWESQLEAYTHAGDIDSFLSDALDTRCRLVRIPEPPVRQVNQRYAKPADHVSFADAYPVLVTATASLDDLNERLAHPIPMSRFRPNIVVETTVPFEEDSWTSVRFGQLAFRFVKPCDRCAIVTTDQQTGARSDEPLRTLATFRKRGNGVDFGMNAVPDQEGMLHVSELVNPSYIPA